MSGEVLGRVEARATVVRVAMMVEVVAEEEAVK
jgi:hypothetical protein